MTTATATANTTKTARFQSRCPRCKETIYPGAELEKATVGNKRYWVHVNCEEKSEHQNNGRHPTTGNRRVKRRRATTSRHCVRCQGWINKGDWITPWDDGPSKSNGYKHWVHESCTATTAEPESNGHAASDEQVKQQILAALKEIDLDREVGKIVDSRFDHFRSEVKKMVEEHAQPRQVEVKQPDGTVRQIDGHTHEAFETVLQLASMRKNIFLPGPAGCGKSHMAKQVAEALGLSFYSISCSAGMSEGQLLGRLLPVGENGQFEYVISDFVRAYENGGVFLMDEMDAADPNVLITINTALANGELSVPNRPDNPVAKRHPDFVFIAAANTFGRGADRMYVGREELDEATLDRFRIGTVPMDYDNRLEAQLCPDDQLRERLMDIRNRAQENRLERIVSSRFMADAYEMVASCGWSHDRAIGQLLQDWSDDEKRKVGC